MKPLRFLFKNGALALLGLSMFSCVDNSYDLSNLSGKAELFKNSLSAPVGTLTIHMDSVIGGMGVDASILTVKDGIYVFGYKGTFNLSGITNEFNQFKLDKILDAGASIPVYDASGFPPNTPDFPLPATEAKTHHGSTFINLPSDFGSPDLIAIDSIELKNTRLNITTESFGLSAAAGKKLGDFIKVNFKAVGKAADYYVNGVKTDHWTMKFGEPCNVEIRKIRLTEGTNKLELERDVVVEIPTLGDILVTDMMQTRVDINIAFENGIDYNELWGDVTYQLPRNTVAPIKFDGLGDLISENDVLSIYDPKITLNTVGNLGVPIDLNLYMNTTNTKTGVTSNGLTNATFHMAAALNPSTPKTNSITLNRTNGTAGLFSINPDIIQMGYDANTVAVPGKNHFIAKNSQLSLDYQMEIPLQFGNDLKISIDTTLENPFGDNLEMLDNQKDLEVELTLNVENKIPLNMQLELEALDENQQSLFTIESDTIKAAKVNSLGLSTEAESTSTGILLSKQNINQLKYTKMFRVKFIVTGKQGVNSVSVQPSDYITLKIGGKINGGVLLDFDSKN